MKVLIVVKDLYTGGIQRSCVNMANFLSRSGIDVDLMIFNKNGPLLNEIDDKIRLIEGAKSLLPFAVSQEDSKKLGFGFYLKRTLNAIWCKVFGNKKALSLALKGQKELENVYDIVISSSGSVGTKTVTVGCPEVVLQKTKAREKWCFVHGDYEKSGLNEPYANSIYEKFDRILCVSESCANIMKSMAPQLAPKVDFLYNVCNDADIREKSKEFKVELSDKLNLITVARLSEEKGHIRFLTQLKKLHDEGFNFCYSIVGDGNERVNIQNFIKNNQMDDYVKMFGNQHNPYPYIKAADLFVLPSFHEAAPMVYAESFVCGVPVLSTNTRSAQELVGDKGFVSDNSGEGIYEKLKWIFANRKMVEDKVRFLSNYVYENEFILDKFKKLTVRGC